MLYVIPFFPQSFTESIEHAITETIDRQEIVPFRAFVETRDSQDTRNLGMFIQHSLEERAGL